MDTFTYDLPLQERSIRLVRIIQDYEQNMLSIRIVEANVDDANFEALSYVWGDQTARTRIKCNGKWTEIGANLYAALHERRRRKSKELIWADQICIDQKNIDEKTRQVRLMSTIYAKANRVIIWLGNRQPGDLEGLSLAETLYQKCHGEHYDADADIYDFHDFDCSSIKIPDPKFNKTWAALFQIISNPWFGRVWIIQELLMAQKSVMWKGSLDLSTDVVLWSAMLIARHRNLYENYSVEMGNPQNSALMARNIAAGYYDFKKKGPLPLYDTLSRNPGMGATDSRDRFFALVGVSSGITAAFVNYKRPFKELACLVGKITLLGISSYQYTEDGTESLILDEDPKYHRFPIEWLAFHANPQNYELGIPSWIPDLLSPHSPGLLMTGFYNSLYLQEWRNVPHPEVSVSEQFRRMSGQFSNSWQMPVPNEIRIKGAIFDRVRSIARNRPELPSPDLDAKSSQINFLDALEAVSKYETEMVYWLSEIRMLADPSLDSRESIMDGPSFDMFWRTLLYNRGPRFDYMHPNQSVDHDLAVAFGYWYLQKKFEMARRWQDDLLAWVSNNVILKKLAEPFEEAEGRVRHARKFFVSQSGSIGWVPFRTLYGDHICVFRGVRVPFVVRPQKDRWEIIGACYVHGLMDGELWDLRGLDWKFMCFV